MTVLIIINVSSLPQLCNDKSHSKTEFDHNNRWDAVWWRLVDSALWTKVHAVMSYQGSPNFFARRPHELLHKCSRSEILRIVIVSGYVTCHQINKFFVNIWFLNYWQNVFAAGCNAWPAGFGPRAVVWRPLSYTTNVKWSDTYSSNKTFQLCFAAGLNFFKVFMSFLNPGNINKKILL